MTEQTFDTIKVNRTGRVITVELNRPDALNALNSKMTEEVTSYLASLDEDKDTGCFVLTGTGKAFAAGADIKEINTVRKHLSKIKGGNLLKMSFPAKVHSFILSDVIGDDLSSISSGPTVPDETSFNDVKKILIKYNLWNDVHKSIKAHIELGILDKSFERDHVLVEID